RRPPSSNLFPYTTLFRSLKPEQVREAIAKSRSIDRDLFQRIDKLLPTLDNEEERAAVQQARVAMKDYQDAREGWYVLLPDDKERSEEHTSELQSPCNLVC